jgi:ketosteroid isomerase-like protein
MVSLETKGWNTKIPDLFLSMIHPDMARPFHLEPISVGDRVFVMGRFDRERWRKEWQSLFDVHDLLHNRRNTVKIEMSKEEDAAFAVVDTDTLWRDTASSGDFLWKGRVCKIYTKLANGEWKFYY